MGRLVTCWRQEESQERRQASHVPAIAADDIKLLGMHARNTIHEDACQLSVSYKRTSLPMVAATRH